LDVDNCQSRIIYESLSAYRAVSKFKKHNFLNIKILRNKTYLCIKPSGYMHIYHYVWMILLTIYRAQYIICTTYNNHTGILM